MASNTAASVLPRPAQRTDVLRRIGENPVSGGPREMRGAFRRLALGAAGPFDALPPDVAVAAEGDGHVIRPRARRSTGAPVIWFHGGGYVFGAPDTHLRPAAWLASFTGRTVLLPSYRLAPEHPWPAQLDDALDAAARYPGAVLAGDSAGGHLALVAALALARRGTPAERLLLFSPNTDRTGLNRSRAEMSAIDPMVDDAEDRRLARMCFAGRASDDPEVSPLLDDLALLPPTHVEVGMPEVLYEDAELLVERGRAAGARVTIGVTPGLPHMGQLWAPFWDDATGSLVRAARSLRPEGRESAA
jgi:acetyl esterase/lipase